MENDDRLLHIAKKRVAFKKHLVGYIVVNSFFWALWFLNHKQGITPWPVWSMLGWGIGLAFSYFNAYIGFDNNAVQSEYEKLKRQGK